MCTFAVMGVNNFSVLHPHCETADYVQVSEALNQAAASLTAQDICNSPQDRPASLPAEEQTHEQTTLAPVEGFRGVAEALRSRKFELTVEQVDQFKKLGFIVIPGILDDSELQDAIEDFDASLQSKGCNTSLLSEDSNEGQASRDALAALSSTGGAGGVLDMFYDDWKLRLTLGSQSGCATRYAKIAHQLMAATFLQNKNCEPSVDSKSQESPLHPDDPALWAHPFGPAIPPSDQERENGCSWNVFAHVDRVGFRVPDKVSELHSQHVAQRTHKVSNKRIARRLQLQRSLTPHLDCCPVDLHYGGGKAFPRWRPIQCMISLTDTTTADHGGFECVPGFHREFHSYFRKKAALQPDGHASAQYLARNKLRSGTVTCVGDYCAIQPHEDADILKRFTHIPIPAGAAVFWDQRLPHANARHNQASVPRRVVYGGFLPRVPRNIPYVQEQLRRFLRRVAQVDFWIEGDGSSNEDKAGVSTLDNDDFFRRTTNKEVKSQIAYLLGTSHSGETRN